MSESEAETAITKKLAESGERDRLREQVCSTSSRYQIAFKLSKLTKLATSELSEPY